MKMMTKVVVAAVMLASTSGAASAATVVLVGDNTGGPTYRRPLSTTILSSIGTNVFYQAYAFSVDVAGSYTLSALSTYDNYLSLYNGAFTPSSALTNLTNVDDDSGLGANAEITTNLLAGTAYKAVFASYYNGQSGPFTLSITGPGTATLGEVTSAVPEPATWAMMMLGLGAVGYSMRRRQKVATHVKFA